ncbi:MAG: CRP-like cAMP-binding protein [Flavobacteriales bacterium]|jgi:CRP-like cAMP-binding protein
MNPKETSIVRLLEKAGSFSEKETALLTHELQFQKIEKDAFLLQKGAVCSAICFVVSGCMYQYNIDADGNENVIDIHPTHDWVLNHKSFSLRKPSEMAIQTCEDSEVYVLSIDAIHRLIALSPSFLQMGAILERATTRIAFFDNNNTPDEKYQFILDNKPQLLQKFSQKIIASYLKMTPETLSRVRKRFSKI